MPFPLAISAQKWPNGADGDLVVSATNQYMDISSSTSIMNYRNVTINSGCTLWLRVTDGSPMVMGVLGNLTVNGTIRIIDRLTDSSWPASTVLSRAYPTLNNQAFSWTTPAARTGGGGAAKGFGRGGDGGSAGSQGGGTGGGYATNGGNGGVPSGSESFTGWGGTNNCSGFPIGMICTASNGTSAFKSGTLTTGYGGGRNYNNGENGGSGSGCGAGGGGGYNFAFPNISGGGGGGTGGWPGRNGGALLIIVRGYITGSGSIVASGETGRNGFDGGNGVRDGSVNGNGGQGGGGGAGGAGGLIRIRYNSLTGVTTSAAAGTGGNGGLGGTNTGGGRNSSGSSGPNGVAGVVDVAPS